MKQFCKADNTY